MIEEPIESWGYCAVRMNSRERVVTVTSTTVWIFFYDKLHSLHWFSHSAVLGQRLRNNLSCEYWGVFLQSSPRHRFTLLKIFEQKSCKTSIYMYSSATKGLVSRSLTTSEWVVYAGPSSDRTWVLVYRYRLETLLFYYCLDRWSATN